MQERLPRIDANIEAIEQYGESSLNADIRRLLYNYAVPPRDLWQEIADKLEITQTSRILDIGTGNGQFVDKIDAIIDKTLGSQYRDNVMAIDKFDSAFSSRLPDERFRWGNAEQLAGHPEIPENSQDVATCLFLFYHINDPESSLAQIKKILKPGGQLVVATRSPGNHRRLWEFGNQIGKAAHLEPPKSFYYRFDINRAREVLSGMFEIEEESEQNSPLRVNLDEQPGDGAGWTLYKQALYTLLPSMRGLGVDSQRTANLISDYVNGSVKDEFVNEAKLTSKDSSGGYFTDWVHQGYFICRNIK